MRVEGQRVRDPAIVLYTSGTTCAPRGAVLTHEAFVRVWMSSGRIFATTSDDKQYNPLPLFHVAAIGSMTWVIGHGATFISDYLWDAGRALRAMEAERATQFFPAYQPIMEDFLGHPDFARHRPERAAGDPQHLPARRCWRSSSSASRTRRS